MKRQIPVRHESPELEQRLKALAAARGESMNATILHLLRQALGGTERRRRLERYVTWSEDDARSFADTLDHIAKAEVVGVPATIIGELHAGRRCARCRGPSSRPGWPRR